MKLSFVGKYVSNASLFNNFKMPNIPSNAPFKFLSLSNVKPKRKLHHVDSIRLAKRQKRCPLRKKKENVDANKCSFTSDQNDDIPEVYSVTFVCDGQREQAHENFIEVVSNATFVYDDYQQGQAHQNIAKLSFSQLQLQLQVGS